MVGLAAIALGAGAISSLIGASKGNKGQAPEKTGFQALPPEVQQWLLENYLPQVQEYADMPYQAIPMQRAGNPMTDPFASQGLADLQAFSDAAGGYFTPHVPGAGPGIPEAAAPSYGTAAPPASSPDGSSTMDIASQYLMGLEAPQAGSARGYYTGGGFSGDVAAALRNQISSGGLTLSQLGKALSSTGYGQGNSNSSPMNVDFAALDAALRRK